LGASKNLYCRKSLLQNATRLETRRKPLIPKTGSRGVLGQKSPTPLAPTQKIQWGKRLIPLNTLVAALSSLSHPTERRPIVVYVALGELPVVFRWSSWQRRACPCVVLSSVEKRSESRLKARDVRLLDVTGRQRLGRIAQNRVITSAMGSASVRRLELDEEVGGKG